MQLHQELSSGGDTVMAGELAKPLADAKDSLLPQLKKYNQFKADLALASSQVLGQDALQLSLRDVQEAAESQSKLLGGELPRVEQEWLQVASQLSAAMQRYNKVEAGVFKEEWQRATQLRSAVEQ